MTVLTRIMTSPARGGDSNRLVGLALTGVLVVLAAAAGYVGAHDLTLALMIVMLPMVTWFLTQRRLLTLALAAVLPYVTDVSGGATGFNLALSDLIMVVVMASLLAEWMLTRQAPELGPLKPLIVVLGTYVGLMVILLVFHLGLASAIKTGQRLDIFVFPLIIGVAIARWGDEQKFLSVYAVCTTFYGAAWYFVPESFGLGQKNPVGQAVANALIILIAVQPIRRRFGLLIPVAITALFLTQSRGAIVSVAVALAVLLLMQTGLNRVRAFIAMIPLAAVTVVAFRLLPEDVQERNTSFSSGTATTAEYAIHIRDQYHQDAWQLIHAHPWTGVGVGRYAAGNPLDGTATTDPHQVLLLQTAEGGYPLALAFILLIAGTGLIVWRVAGKTPLGPLAVALHFAIFSHGLVDVYWVRGTPVLGWLVIGMALAQAARRPPPEGRAGSRAGGQRERSPVGSSP